MQTAHEAQYQKKKKKKKKKKNIIKKTRRPKQTFLQKRQTDGQ